MSYIEEVFSLSDETSDYIQSLCPKFGFDGFGEVIFYRTYSRVKRDIYGNEVGQESWNDVVERVTNGTFTIRKDFYLKNKINWNEIWWQAYARKFAESLFHMFWVPPGRGLWAMGTSFIYERGSMALYNCSYTKLTGDNLADDIEWLMDSLMLGVGVGFEPVRDNFKVFVPQGTFHYIIEDTRESWAHSVRLLIEAFTLPNSKLPIFDYRRIRPEGLPIRGFGGLSSGPDPLKALHQQIITYFERYLSSTKDNPYDIVRLKTDIANAVGCCVVAGNVRRSAEIALGEITDQTFLELKNYEKYPERKNIGWMSNNTVKCIEDEHFELLGEIAKRVVVRGEPGFANLKNFPIGRVGKKKQYPSGRKDNAIGLNPCGEITLEHRETCNVVETCPTRCPNVNTWYEACNFASFYASTVALLPTHQSSTNAVVARNRRIGVSIIDGAYWIQTEGLHKVTKYLRNGYKIITETNKWANGEAGVPEAIKKTTIKPGGTVPKLTGGIGGIGYATFNYTLRRVRIAHNNPIVPILTSAGVPYEPDIFDPKTLIFEFPTYQHGKPAEKTSLWEQAFNLVTFQREWSDNAVSNTLYFKPKWTLKKVYSKLYGHKIHLKDAWRSYTAKFFGVKRHDLPNVDVWDDGSKKFEITRDEKTGRITQLKLYDYNPNHEEDVIAPVMAHIAPLIKSCSLLPHAEIGVYPQMPEEGLTEKEYQDRTSVLGLFDWSTFSGSDGIDERYCHGPNCETGVK
jgi:ribonucleoside-triphosphate reductase